MADFPEGNEAAAQGPLEKWVVEEYRWIRDRKRGPGCVLFVVVDRLVRGGVLTTEYRRRSVSGAAADTFWNTSTQRTPPTTCNIINNNAV